MHQHRTGGRETTIPAIVIDNGFLNERDDQLQETAGAPILVSKCDSDRWTGAAIVPTKGADEYAVAELKKDVICNGFAEVLVRSDNEPAILALKESAATALKLAGVNVKIEESALCGSRSNGLAESAVKDVKKMPVLRQTIWTGVPRRTSSPDLVYEALRGDGEQVQERSRWQDSQRAAQGKFARALPHFAEKILFTIPGVTKGVAGVEPRWEDGIFLGVSDRSDELYVGTERGMHKVRTDVARPQNELTSRS